MKFTKKWNAIIAAFGITAMLAGCNQNNSTPNTQTNSDSGNTGKKYTFAIIPKMLNNPVFQLAEKGARAEATRIGNIDIIFDSSEKGDPAEQTEKIRSLAQKVDGMAISVVDATAAKEAIDEAANRGKHVICFDSGAEGSKAITLYSVDDKAVGRELANQLLEACGGKEQMKGKVAILSGQSSAPNLIGRVDGAKEVMAQYPGIEVLPIIYCEDSGARAVEQIRTTMQANPDLRGWIMVGGWPLFEKNALDSIKNIERTKVVCMDALPQQWSYLESGQVYCLVAQKCFGWGEQSVRILHELASGAKKPSDYPKLLDSGYDLVYKTPAQTALARKSDQMGVYSLDDYEKQYQAWETGGQTK